MRGPPELAANFIKDISSRGLLSTSSLRHLPSEGSFDLVSEGGAPAQPARVPETRDQIAATLILAPAILESE